MTDVKVLLAVLAAALAFLALGAGRAEAHPLGNFTVNRYAGIEIAGDTVYLRYAVDLAEVPTYQLGDEVRRAGYASRLARGLELTIDGRRAALRVLDRRLVTSPGAAGLETLRLDVVYVASRAGSRVALRERTFPGRIGWREITVAARAGAAVVRSSVPASSDSSILREYPAELLRSPLDVTRASALVELGETTGTPPEIDDRAAGKHESARGFESLVDDDLSPGVLLVSFLVAAFWGAAHALTPGHGKALVAAYLVGTRGRPRHALLLGGTVTVAHTAGVFALGLVTLALSSVVVPERLYPWLSLVSGLLVVVVGASVLRARFRRSRYAQHHHHHHGHEHEHDGGARGILGVGVAAGILPCPSALVVLLSAIALHRVGLGLALIVAFSLGLAATITAVGLVAVLARRAFGRLSLDGPLVRSLPAVSAALILIVGVVITARALPGVV